MKKKHTPLRTCLGCREVKPKRDLIRMVISSEGRILFDTSSKLPGRGAYLCPESDCFRQAVKKKAIQRALNVELTDQVGELEEKFIKLVKLLSS